MAGENSRTIIFRRLAQHFRRQDWLAVGLELLIVITGVFLGLQVSNWNEERADREDEQAIIERLHLESGALLDEVRTEREALGERVENLVSAQTAIYSMEAARELTPDECHTVAFSHIYRKPPDELPILDELIETGRFDRLQDTQVRLLLREYILFRDQQRANHDERTNELFRLYSRHPQTVAVGLQPEDGEPEAMDAIPSDPDYEWTLACNLGAMQSNQAFLNEYMDNMGRNGNILRAYGEREELLQRLQERLDNLLDQ